MENKMQAIRNTEKLVLQNAVILGVVINYKNYK